MSFTPKKITELREQCAEELKMVFPWPEDFRLAKLLNNLPIALDEIEKLKRERGDLLKKLEDAQGEIEHLKDTRRDPWDKLEVAASSC